MSVLPADVGPAWMPEISELSIAPDRASLSCRLRVPGDLAIFHGHFPEVPIVPGIVEVGWAVELARRHGLVEGYCSGIVTAKFKRLVLPGMILDARLQRGTTAGQLQFRFESTDSVVSTGRLQFRIHSD